jgi:hypothetical protein
MPQPSGTFTSRLSTARSPSPSLGITTTVTGLLCWRDLHPLEWQLASLHGHFEPPSFVAATAELASIADAGEGVVRPSPPRRRVLPNNRPPRRAAVASDSGQ